MRLALGLLALMLLIAGVSFWAWRAAPEPPPCIEVAISSSRSPDARTDADLFERRCGDSVTTHVALRPSGAPIASHAAVFVAAGRVRARLAWSESGELVIESPAQRVLLEETHWRRVGVRIRRVR